MLTYEDIAYWYMRLNGFLSLQNFVIHDDINSNVRTEIDVVGSRLKFRCENLSEPMVDDPLICDSPSFLKVIFAEVKRGKPEVNEAWKKPENLAKMVRAIGCAKETKVEIVVQNLLTKGRHISDDKSIDCQIAIFAESHYVGKRDLCRISWKQSLNFIYGRLQKYSVQKMNTSQWPAAGKKLKEFVDESREFKDFFQIIRGYATWQ